MFQGLLKGTEQVLSGSGLTGHANLEKRIVEMMLADYAWEQVIYDIIASEGLDPWNLDLNTLSSSFLSYMGKIKELDFRIPAKYVIISSVILRMKSEGLKMLDIPTDSEDGEPEEYFAVGKQLPLNIAGLDVSMLDLHGRRRPTKPIMVTDLVRVLKKMLNTQELKDFKIAAAKSAIRFDTVSITERINSIYSKINSMLSKIKTEEIEFSKVVEKWDRKSVVDHFLPLVYLDNENKVDCRQENCFDEIYIKKVKEVSNNNVHSPEQPNGNSKNVLKENKIVKIKNYKKEKN